MQDFTRFTEDVPGPFGKGQNKGGMAQNKHPGTRRTEAKTMLTECMCTSQQGCSIATTVIRNGVRDLIVYPKLGC